MTTWSELRSELNVSSEDEAVIEMEKNLIKTLVQLREEQGLTQAQLAEKCNLNQPSIGRLELAAHSPRVDTLLRVLAQMGYTLQIVPMNKK